ncbi:hypothetical protein [Mesorhizobium sp. M0701]|uniref:hypothetical protein n=1 Tax=Mesorhizobium sp. M0701 TaxID=2956989 RepID=UPI003336DAA8
MSTSKPSIAIRWQEGISVDVLLYGEIERNDIVSSLQRTAFTSPSRKTLELQLRYVGPPIIYGDTLKTSARRRLAVRYERPARITGLWPQEIAA